MAKKPVLWLTRHLTMAAMDRAKGDYDAISNEEDRPRRADEIIEMSSNVDAILPCQSEKFTADVADKLDPRVKIIASHSVGMDHCDLAALKKRGIIVTNTPDILSDATAEIAMLLLLGAARRAVEGDKIVRTGGWDFWNANFMLGRQVSGQRIGIIGMGRIGQIMAKRARGFDMEVHYHNRSRLSEELERGAIFHERVEDLMVVSDFLSIHCPATAQNTGMMNDKLFALLPRGAVFVNTARGALVDEAALMRALDNGQLSAAGLDCFVNEPGGNPKFASYDNIFMQPHLGSATVKTRDAMGFRALDNLDAYFSGKNPRDAL